MLAIFHGPKTIHISFSVKTFLRPLFRVYDYVTVKIDTVYVCRRSSDRHIHITAASAGTRASYPVSFTVEPLKFFAATFVEFYRFFETAIIVSVSRCYSVSNRKLYFTLPPHSSPPLRPAVQRWFYLFDHRKN